MIDFTTLTIVDYAVVFVLFLSAVFSTLRGMTREFLGLLGWVVSVVSRQLCQTSAGRSDRRFDKC